MVDALWSNFNDLSLLHPIKCSRSLNRDIALVDRSEVEEVGFDISVRDRTTLHIPSNCLRISEIFVVSSVEMKSLGACCIVVEGDNKEELW